MAVSSVVGFLFGHSNSIRTVASTQASFWTGLILVLLTGIARNYDQTYILEDPLRWLLGPLLFSLFSGTWVFFVAHGIAWGYMGPQRPSFWSGWPAFMGLFWMTAPIAWLYAIPVERFFDSLTAARANVALLSVVSLWRVLLMARVFQVLHGPKFLMALSWTLIPATIEVLAVSFFGGGFSKRVMAAMTGMRNSPEEDVLLSAMGNAFSIALAILPVAVLTAVAWRMKADATPFPARSFGRVPWSSLAVATASWVLMAIIPQREVANNAAVDDMVAKGEFRQALDFLANHSRSEFAPSRTLSPKPFEREVFEQLPGLFREVKSTDPLWVHEHLVMRLTQMSSHFDRRINPAKDTQQERIDATHYGMQRALQFAQVDGFAFRSIFNGLEQMPAGPPWLKTNDVLLTALARLAAEADVVHGRNSRPQESQRADWASLTAHLAKLGITNIVIATNIETQSLLISTNLPATAAKPAP